MVAKEDVVRMKEPDSMIPQLCDIKSSKFLITWMIIIVFVLAITKGLTEMIKIPALLFDYRPRKELTK